MKLSGTTRKKKTVKTEPKRNKESVNNKSGRIVLVTSLAFIALVLILAVAGMTYVGNIDSIFPNVRVDGFDVGGMTILEASEYLAQKGVGNVGDASVTVCLPQNISMTLSARDYISSAAPEEAAITAYDYCKGGSAVEDALTYLRCRSKGMDLFSDSSFKIDESSIKNNIETAVNDVQLALLDSELNVEQTKITVTKGAASVIVNCEELTSQIISELLAGNNTSIIADAKIETDEALDLQKIFDSIFVEKADARFLDDFSIEPERTGVSFDLEKAQKLWDKAAYGERVQFDLIMEDPEVTAEELEALLFRDQLSAKTTSLWGSTDNRINNVSIAANSINGIVLLPGEEFSYNPTLGKRTPENGYLLAGAYSGGQTVQEYGGGICQVSSTLYYCCLYANLKITSRTCHYFPVSYLPAGLDATVSWGGPEYKFVNNRDYPIKIVASADAKEHTLTVELWGTDVDGSYVDMTYGTWIVYDEEYPDVAIGYKAKTYRNVYAADGTKISSREEASSYYHYHDEDIKWPEETEEPTETESPQSGQDNPTTDPSLSIDNPVTSTEGTELLAPSDLDQKSEENTTVPEPPTETSEME